MRFVRCTSTQNTFETQCAHYKSNNHRCGEQQKCININNNPIHTKRCTVIGRMAQVVTQLAIYILYSVRSTKTTANAQKPKKNKIRTKKPSQTCNSNLYLLNVRCAYTMLGVITSLSYFVATAAAAAALF